MLKICNGKLNRPGGGRPILEGINLEFNSGEFVIVIGTNGSGKSSLFKVIKGHYSLSEGSLTQEQGKLVSLGQDLSKSTFSTLSVLENMSLATALNESAILRLLEEVNPELILLKRAPVSTLSGGLRQSLALAMSLAQNPNLLLLDEHTSALDPEKASYLMEKTAAFIREKKLTALMTTHQLGDALKYGDRLIALKEGKVILDVKGEEKATLSEENLLALYR